MTEDAPLRLADVASVVERLVRRRGHLSKPAAVFGSGPGGQIEVNNAPVDVVPVRSELELRAKLVEYDGCDTAVVFLVDFADQVPLDVAYRLTGQRIFPVDQNARLQNLFRARRVAAGFASTALAQVLLEESPELPPIAGTLLQPDEAWRRYLQLHLGVGLDSPPRVDVLLQRAVRDPDQGVAFARRRDDARWTDLLDEARDWLATREGPAATVVFGAWLAGHSQDLVGWLVHIDAARRAGDAGAARLLRQALRYAPAADERWVEPPVVDGLCDGVNAYLEALEPPERAGLLQHADALFRDPEFAAAREASPWLPEGFAALQTHLASALERVLDEPDALDEALEKFRKVEGHHLAAAGDGHHRVREAGMRLATWLASVDRWPLPDEPGPDGMAALAQWYAREGGRVDWAREVLRLRDTGHAGLDAVLKRILARVDALRRDADRRFAEAALAWHAADKPATDVLPIERVTRDVVARFLEGNPQRRLLVVMLDGMSMAVAQQLLHAKDDWGPVLWNPGKHHEMPPAIAALPSLTRTSRAAFFAGKHDPRHGDQAEGKDVERFAANPSLADFVEARPQLFLKAELGSGNTLAQPLLDALQSETERVVAVVVNAIDDQLKGSDQIGLPYDEPGAIPVFDRLLRAAAQTERAVLLVSDHGHVPAQVMSGSRAPASATEGGARWRALDPSQVLQEGEVELPAGCWTPKGADRVAVWVDETRAWGNAAHGAHGGLTLAEVVIPVVLMATHSLHTIFQPDDPAVHTQDAAEPRWWQLRKSRVRAPEPVTPPPQPDLFAPATPVPAPTADETPSGRHPVAEALAASELFVARGLEQSQVLRDLAIDFVDVLVREPGEAMSMDAFARAVGIKVRRIPQKVAQIGFLNADGFTVIEEDVSANQVRLNLDRLRAQYGLP